MTEELLQEIILNVDLSIRDTDILEKNLRKLLSAQLEEVREKLPDLCYLGSLRAPGKPDIKLLSYDDVLKLLEESLKNSMSNRNTEDGQV